MNIPLNIDWQQILLHFFNFSILVGGLYLLLFKPVKSFMEKREKHYADMEAAAVAREKDTEALKAAMAQREADFDAVLEEKRAAAAKEAEAFAQQQRDAAKAQADKILSDAKDAAESERQKIVAEANREAVAIAEDAMEKLMAAQTAQAYDAFGNAAQPAAKQSGSRIHTAQSKHFQYVIYTPPFHSSGSQLFFSVYRGGTSSAVTGPASGTAPAVCRSKPR